MQEIPVVQAEWSTSSLPVCKEGEPVLLAAQAGCAAYLAIWNSVAALHIKAGRGTV